MIAVEEDRDLIRVSVFGELTLSDFREFEQAVKNELKSAPNIKLLLDFTKMTGFTLDVAWEDIKFTRAHAHDFQKIAVISPSEWVSWLSWVSAAFTDATVQIFDDARSADAWLTGSGTRP